MENTNDSAPNQNPAPSYAHPLTALFHVLFKAVAILWYLFCTWVTKSFVINFVVCIVLLALDFWTVKNISGRLLVGLRWWNEVEEDGSSKWQFESLEEGQRTVNRKDKGVFWLAVYAAPMVWALMVVLAIFRFTLDYLLIAVIGFILSGTNLYGYYKCSKEQKRKMESYAQGMMSQGIVNAINRFI
uniref:Golgi apparatus membrane protein TVP23 n=1 Tax=Tetraselmis sp. GSL018 TaxID=582737 RepID=A0A061S1A6_9CHLO|mmetsp:Transcript_29369/g.69987  ORF Transcript_29369/g.69987 Transcript_29369/m.69987 type:complete len:186 (+) Transcript_29369:261-818(+)